MTSVSVIMCATDRPQHLKNTLQAWSVVGDQDVDFTIVDNNSGNPDISRIANYFSGIMDISFYWEDSWNNVNRLWNRYGKGSDGEYVVFAMMDEIISSKDILQKMTQIKDSRASIFTYFMSEAATNGLEKIPWRDDPQIIPKPFTDQTSAGLISHITGAYREYWDWFGWFRDDQDGHLWLDQDVHLREVCLGNTCQTPAGVYCLHQCHPANPFPPNYAQPGYSYHNEAQARLLEPAVRDLV